MEFTNTDAHEHHQTPRDFGDDLAVYWNKAFNKGIKEVQKKKENL
jgi:hypothetical protein